MKKLEVVVIGGGLAGLSCAVHLINAGVNVLVLESKDVLGGREATVRSNNINIESSIQPFFEFYREIPRLLNTIHLHSRQVIQWYDAIEFRLPDNGHTRFITEYNDASTHLNIATLGQRLIDSHYVSSNDVESLRSFARNGLRDLNTQPEILDTMSVETYAKRHQVSLRAVERILYPITKGIFLTTPDVYSAYAFFKTIEHEKNTDRNTQLCLGTFVSPISDTLIEPLRSYIEKKGGEILTDVEVEGIKQNSSHDIWEIDNQWEKISSPDIVVATTITDTQRLLAHEFEKKPWIRPIMHIKSHPLIALQLQLEKELIEPGRLVFAPTTSIVNMHSSINQQTNKTHLSILVANPRDKLKRDSAALIDDALHDFQKLGYDTPKVLHGNKFVTTQDYYWHTTGTEALRPLQKTPCKGLYLASDYTKQPYMATAEGAVTSGRLAAEALIRERADR